MNKPGRKLRVGVTIHIRDGKQSIWENGIFQNCVFLVQLFNLSPEVEKAVLVNGSGAKEVHPSMMFSQAGVEMIHLQEALETLDVVVEMSSQVPEGWLEKFRAKGGRIAWMRCGNDFVIDIERAMNNLPPAGLCSEKVYDAIWTLPEYKHSCTDYFATTTRAPVKIVPHLWTPEFFDKGTATLTEGFRFSYEPGKARWRVCSFEPNVCMVKTCAIPMLICEEAYRLAPGKFEAIRICNTLQSKENPAFVRFARYLDIVNHGVASFEGRFAVYEYMAHHGDCVVSHHWENGQNYLYYEILHGGYPLIHNSEFIRDLGYFYPDFDCQAGGEALIRAFDIHDQNLDDYKSKAAEFLKTLDICHQPNIEAYTDELLALFDSGKTGDPPKAQKKRTSPARIKPETGQGGENSALPAAQARAIDQIHLINLDRRPDRLERFTQSHPELEARFQRFSAYDGKALKLTPALARLFAPNNFNWHKATMGCALSHLALWHRLAETDGENWLILEDDARLLPGWESAITQALKPGVLPEDWEIFFLGGVLPKYRDFFEANVQPLPGGIGRVKEDCVFGKNPPGYFHFCAYSYLLSQRGAKRLLELVEKGNGVWMQADFLAAYTTPDLSPPRPVYFAHPLVAESFQDSEEGFARPYGDDEKSSAKVDSDIWKEKDCFTLEEVAACRSDGLTLDIAGALAEPEAVARKKQFGALGEATLPSPSQPIPGIDQIWVINLERRKDRLEKFLNNNPDIAKEVSILKAYDGKKLQLTPKIARLFAPNEFHWNKATMGCSLSHLELWYRLANEPGENATYLIFEDDTKLTAGWRDIVEQAFTTGQLPQDWDVIYLGGILPKNEQYFAQCKERIAGPISRIVPNGWFGQKPPNRYFHFCTNAYLLGKRGANKLLEFIRLKNGIWPQADMLLAYVTPPDYPVHLNHYLFDPLLAHCYQDLENGFIKSYADKSEPGKLDSDIWLENEKFDAEHAAIIINLQEPYDIIGALQDARLEFQVQEDVATSGPKISMHSKIEWHFPSNNGAIMPQNLGQMVLEGHLGGFFSEGDGGTYYPLMWSELGRKYSIRSVLDVGCGRGYSALYFKSLGCSIKGVDGSKEAWATNLLGEDFVMADYSIGPSPIQTEFDLVWSCEFVEHVEERFMQNYLQDFRRGRFLAMTFAGPGQPGHHHVNCRPAEYWIRIMHSQGFDYMAEETLELRELAKKDMEKNNRESEKRFVYHFIDRGLFFRNSAFF